MFLCEFLLFNPCLHWTEANLCYQRKPGIDIRRPGAIQFRVNSAFQPKGVFT